MKYILIYCLILISFISCKKELPYYSTPEELKEYFGFKVGSHWIYKNDSTNEIDSTYVIEYLNSEELIRDQYTFELVSTRFHSHFLSTIEVLYSTCLGNNIVLVSGNSLGGPVIYSPGWPTNNQVISTGCLSGELFVLKIIPVDTINNVIYHNVLYTKTQSIDSNATDPYFFSEIYFAKNIGIIKYFEKNHYQNIIRSRSLLRYTAHQ
jgi:hypothetical protein